jgi:hypothetical protein
MDPGATLDPAWSSVLRVLQKYNQKMTNSVDSKALPPDSDRRPNRSSADATAAPSRRESPLDRLDTIADEIGTSDAEREAAGGKNAKIHDEDARQNASDAPSGLP